MSLKYFPQNFFLRKMPLRLAQNFFAIKKTCSFSSFLFGMIKQSQAESDETRSHSLSEISGGRYSTLDT